MNWRSFNVALCAGVDEVGRGCLAGPVFSAAVILRPETRIRGLTDSKLIAPEERGILAEKIKLQALAWAVGEASVEEIDQINILQASLLSMRRAVEKLAIKPELLLIDGDKEIGGSWSQKTFVKGDLRLQPISAASIVAKVARDSLMTQLDQVFPGYGFSKHKGYATEDHRKVIEVLGPCSLHRKTFSGVTEFLR